MASLWAGCDDPDPPCEVYESRGYWGRVPDGIGLTREEVLTLDTLASLDEGIAIRHAGLHANCHTGYLFVTQHQGTLPPGSDTATTCAALVDAIRDFRVEKPNALDGVYTTGAPACAVNYRGYLQDVAYCTGAELEASAVSCSGSSRFCADPNEPGPTCLECEGELSHEGLSEECAVVLSARASWTARCPTWVVARPTEVLDPYTSAQVTSLVGVLEDLPAMLDKALLALDGLAALQRALPQTLQRRRVRACQEPANAALDETIAALNAQVEMMRDVLDALEEAD